MEPKLQEISSPVVEQVASHLAQRFHPELMYLYNLKTNPQGETTSFKISVVLDTRDKYAAEHKAYLSIDADVPFDLLFYTVSEWEELQNQPYSFARRIVDSGVKIYG